ncbi:MAG: SDR family NAD(P)-dependent oxidoreductase [Aggregatilineales bacterium]
MPNMFEGRTALVTGAAGGIGSAIARRLAANGAHVALADVSAEGAESIAAQIRQSGGSAQGYRLDVTSFDEVRKVVAEVEKHFGLVTLVATCAGIIRTYMFLDLPPDVWDLTMNVNLKGTFLVFQAIARRMVEAGSPGSMVGISSVAGRGGRASAVDYAASKAGVISVVRSAALAFAPHKITVNAVCPGIVDTEMTRSIHRDRSKISGITAEESLAKLVATIPLRRVETAEDVADAVTFLLSPQGGYITGQALNADGGLEFD